MSGVNKKSESKMSYFGMSIGTLLAICAIVVAAAMLRVLPTTIIGAMAICMVLGSLIGYIGDRMPIWKDYFGAGAILAYFGASVFVKYKILDANTVKSITNFIGGYDFLTLFISVLISGSVLSVKRKILIKAISGYIPAILAGIVGATLFGVAAGMLVGVEPGKTLSLYVLPIMGGGTGAGALPMSEMYQTITGQSKTTFLSTAMPILAIGNVFAILFASVMSKMFQNNPIISGGGELVKHGKTESVEDQQYDGQLGMDEIGLGFFVVFGLFMAATITSKKILPTIGGISIHTYAYMVFYAALCNVFNVFSPRTVAGLKKLQAFFTGQLLLIIMFSCGVAYVNLDEVLTALSLGNVFISFMIVLGCVIGSGACAFLINFYPLETVITAGLCMANTGGTGDIAVLGACKRMNLMSFAQISSRIGGGIMLVIASIVFAMYK